MRFKSIYQKILFWMLTLAIGQILIACSAGISGTSGPVQSNLTANESMKIAPIANSSSTSNKLRSTGFSSSLESATITTYNLINGGVKVSGTIDSDNNITVRLPGAQVESRKAYFTTNPSNAVVSINGIPQDGNGGRPYNDYSKPLVYTVSANGYNNSTYTVRVIYNTESSNKITSYSLTNSQKVDIAGRIDDKNSTISVDMTSEPSLSKLIAKFDTTGESVFVDNKSQTSGVTENNFNDPVVYRVKAKNGYARNYTVLVTSNSSKKMVKFGLIAVGSKRDGIIKESNITVAVPFDTDLRRLQARFEIVGKNVTVNGESQTDYTTNDFTKPVVFRVNAINSTYIDYTVTAVKDLSPENRIMSFSIESIAGYISGNNITVDNMPFGTNLTALRPVFTSSKGSKVLVNGAPQKSGESQQDFSKPITYMVRAESGNESAYTVKVNIEPRNMVDYFYILYPNTMNDRADSFIYQGRLIESNIVSNHVIQQLGYPVDAYGTAGDRNPAYTMIYSKDDSYPVFTMLAGSWKNWWFYLDRYSIQSNDGGLHKERVKDGFGEFNDSSAYTFGKIAISPKIDGMSRHIYQIIWASGKYYYNRYSYDASKGFTNMNSTFTSDDTDNMNDRSQQTQIFDIAVTPDGNNAYAALPFTNSVVMYSVDSSTGKLSKLDIDGVISSKDYPYEVVIDPSGQYLFALNAGLNGTASINSFNINRNNRGYLTPKSSAPVPYYDINETLTLPGITIKSGIERIRLRRSLVADPILSTDKEYLYANTSDGIITYSIDMKSGNIKKEHTFPLVQFSPALQESSLGGNIFSGRIIPEPKGADALSVDQNGRYLSVLDNNCNNQVYLFAIDKRNNGKLILVAQFRLRINGSTDCYNSARDPVTVMVERKQ